MTEDVWGWKVVGNELKLTKNGELLPELTKEQRRKHQKALDEYLVKEWRKDTKAHAMRYVVSKSYLERYEFWNSIGIK